MQPASAARLSFPGPEELAHFSTLWRIDSSVKILLSYGNLRHWIQGEISTIFGILPRGKGQINPLWTTADAGNPQTHYGLDAADRLMKTNLNVTTVLAANNPSVAIARRRD